MSLFEITEQVFAHVNVNQGMSTAAILTLPLKLTVFHQLYNLYIVLV